MFPIDSRQQCRQETFHYTISSCLFVKKLQQIILIALHNTKRGTTLANKRQTQMMLTFLWDGFRGRRKPANLHLHFLTILKLLIVRNCNIIIKLHMGLLQATCQAFLHKPPQYPGNLSFRILKRLSQFSPASFTHKHLRRYYN